MSEPLKTNDRCVLVEGPRWGDVEFYGKWLLVAARADVLLKKALNDPVFNKQIDRHCNSPKVDPAARWP
jgi:hypothetical protein